MKFVVKSADLFNHLQAISRVINSKNTLPVMDCFLFELQDGTLSITASDTETTMMTQVEVTESDANGRFAVVAKTLLEAMKEIPDQGLAFEIDPNTLAIVVRYMNGQYNIIGQVPDEYPLPPVLGRNAVHLSMKSAVVLNGISRSIFGTADDELRPVMNGIYFDIYTDNVTMVTSDGHKLVRIKSYASNGTEKSAFILPKKPANLLRNVLPKDESDVNIDFDDRNVIFTTADYKLICRLLEGRYPNYNSVIPQNSPLKVTVDRQALLSALKRVSVFSSAESSLIKLRLQANLLTISAQDIDFSTSAEESMPCDYAGSTFSIGFKAPFLIDILNNLSGQNIELELADPSRAGIIVPSEQEKDEEILMLLMPMMLND